MDKGKVIDLADYRKGSQWTGYTVIDKEIAGDKKKLMEFLAETFGFDPPTEEELKKIEDDLFGDK